MRTRVPNVLLPVTVTALAYAAPGKRSTVAIEKQLAGTGSRQRSSPPAKSDGGLYQTTTCARGREAINFPSALTRALVQITAADVPVATARRSLEPPGRGSALLP
jgi:hypothetical protein